MSDPNAPQNPYGPPQQPGQPSPYGPQQPGHPGAVAYAQPPQPPKKKRRVWLWVLIGFLALMLIVIVACSAATLSAVNSVSSGLESAVPTGTEKAEAPAGDPTGKASSKPKSNLTAEQEEAKGAAEDYLNTLGFSKKGLIRQLSSDAGSGFKKKDAEVAVDSMDVDWNEQAVRAAKSYRESGIHFSRSGLVKQLESDAGSGFTHSQAVYGADHSR